MSLSRPVLRSARATPPPTPAVTSTTSRARRGLIPCMPSNLCDGGGSVKPANQLWLGVAEATKETTSSSQGIYSSFDAFLKQGIREYYDRGWTTRKGNFIALLIASGTTSFALAKDSVVDGSGTKKVALGGGLLIALRIGLKYALGGPLGLVLTVATGASMVAYFVRNQKDIVKKVGKYKTTIADAEKRYAECQFGWRDGKYQLTDRNLMI